MGEGTSRDLNQIIRQDRVVLNAPNLCVRRGLLSAVFLRHFRNSVIHQFLYTEVGPYNVQPVCTLTYLWTYALERLCAL